jgi:hypothetical protein
MSRFAPPKSDVVPSSPAYYFGSAGWVATAIIMCFAVFVFVNSPTMVGILSTGEYSIASFLLGASASVLLLIGFLLLLALFPSSLLFFAASVLCSVLGLRDYYPVLSYGCLLASVGCLVASGTVFFGRHRGPSSGEA